MFLADQGPCGLQRNEVRPLLYGVPEQLREPQVITDEACNFPMAELNKLMFFPAVKLHLSSGKKGWHLW